MGKDDGFLLYNRELPQERLAKVRVKDYKEIYQEFPEEKTREQAARCMDCGVPFCSNGCPLGNNIPEFNDAVFAGDWNLAIQVLEETNNFPEFTGRICPAPCEGSCVLGINKPQVTIEHIEKSIAEKAFELGYILARPPKIRTGKKVAVVGSGPAGLAAADQLNKAGNNVTVYERDQEIGGLLRFGIPDFKLEKWVVERRVEIMMQEGVDFVTGVNVGESIKVDELLSAVDALVLCGGSTVPRDLSIPGRNLKGVHFAMDFLSQQNKRISGISFKEEEISAKGKDVIVIGGGDTGSDCVGTSNRQGAKSVTQFELLPQPPVSRDQKNPWPEWPVVLRTSSSHEEGCERLYTILTQEFIGNKSDELESLQIEEVEWIQQNGKMEFVTKPGTMRVIPCELALLAMGFVHPQREGLLEQLAIATDQKGNVKADGYATNVKKVFAAGDMRMGQSLVVWAIDEGRKVAERVNEFLGV